MISTSTTFNVTFWLFADVYKRQVPISVERLAKGLRALGHEVCIFAPEYEGEEEPEEDVVRYRSHKRKSVSYTHLAGDRSGGTGISGC